MTPTIKFKKLHPNAIIPAYQTAGAAGMDLHWDGGFSDPKAPRREVGVREYFHLGPEIGVTWFYTGLAIEVPEGFEAQIRPRSSTGGAGLLIVNAPGTVDSDYRGEVIIQIFALIPHTRVTKGDRIAQLVIAPVARCVIQVAEELTPTERGGGGFGSTGR